MSASKPFRGIFTIPVTPFHDNGEIDIAGFRRVVDFCVDCGAHGLVYPVNASEFTVLSDAERFELTEVLVEQNAGRLPVIVGVAAVSQEVAAKFSAHARAIGADGVIAMPPYVRKGRFSDSVLFDYYRTIAAAAQIPIFIQNNNPPFGLDMPADLLLRLCREIEHIEYIKEETVPSTTMLSSIVRNNDGSVKGFFGGVGGRYLIEEYRRGTDGNMPGCHVTDVIVAFWNALESQDEARAMLIYKELAPLFFFEIQLSGCYKEVLKRRGVISSARKRNGQMPLDEISSQYLDDILRALQPLMTWGV